MNRSISVRITALLVAGGIGAAAGTSALAAMVTMEANGLGYITPTINPNPSNSQWVTDLNTAIGYFNASKSGPVSSGTFNLFPGGPPPSPVLPAATSVVSNPTGLPASTYGDSAANPVSINLSSTGYTYDYLIVRWDGKNGSDAIYYIGGLTGTITLWDEPSSINADGISHDASGYWLANPTPVPEASTLAAGALLLLPFGAGALRGLRKGRSAR